MPIVEMRKRKVPPVLCDRSRTQKKLFSREIGIGVFAKGAGGAAAPPVLKKFGQNAINSGKITKFRAKFLTAFIIFLK